MNLITQHGLCGLVLVFLLLGLALYCTIWCPWCPFESGRSRLFTAVIGPNWWSRISQSDCLVSVPFYIINITASIYVYKPAIHFV